jgi:DNA-binding HxlR family transcriptional regulator
MTNREYGQYCGLARAAEVVGQRWTLLILRDLRVSPRRYSDLVAGLPGIPTNTLSTRLKELEDDGIITREAVARPERTLVYALTPRGEELGPALDALGLWGAGGMRSPREGEIITPASFVAALRTGAEGADIPKSWNTTYTVRAGDAEAQVVMRNGGITVTAGAPEPADVVITAGPAIRDLLAGELDPEAAVASGAIGLEGDPALFRRFADTLRVPYSPNLPTAAAELADQR